MHGSLHIVAVAFRTHGGRHELSLQGDDPPAQHLALFDMGQVRTHDLPWADDEPDLQASAVAYIAKHCRIAVEQADRLVHMVTASDRLLDAYSILSGVSVAAEVEAERRAWLKDGCAKWLGHPIAAELKQHLQVRTAADLLRWWHGNKDGEVGVLRGVPGMTHADARHVCTIAEDLEADLAGDGR